MCRHIVPELNHIPDWQTKDLRREGYRTVAPELLKKYYEAYEKSWYGKHVHVSPNPDINYNQWWFTYNAASMCEHLLAKGYEIKVFK